MKTKRHVSGILIAVLLGLGIGCSPTVVPVLDDDVSTPADTGDADGDTPPPGTLAVSFTIDDTANQVYLDSDGLAWKGSFSYDPHTRILSYDGVWSGPYPMLHDDGTNGDAVAGDHLWTTTVFAELPDTGDRVFEYGAIRGSVDGSDGQWIWTGSDGTFTVTAGATSAIDADGLTLPAFGTIDLRVTVDTALLAPGLRNTAPSQVEVKSELWGWTLISLADDATNGDTSASDGIYTVQYSLVRDRLNGLAELDQEIELMLVLDGVEYRSSGTTPLGSGVTVLTDWQTAGVFAEETLATAGNNLSIVVGDSDE